MQQLGSCCVIKGRMLAALAGELWKIRVWVGFFGSVLAL